MTTRQNVTIDAVLDPFTDYGDAEATPAAELAIRARARTWDTELEAPSLPALASHVTSRTAEGKMGRRFDPVAVAREARSLRRVALAPGDSRRRRRRARRRVGDGARATRAHLSIRSGDRGGGAERGDRRRGTGIRGDERERFGRRPYGESAKRAAAASVTFLRGLAPMHAAWAGLTSTRYVRQLWLPTGGVGSGRVDVLRCISWSWFYHGTFDFAIMAAPALAPRARMKGSSSDCSRWDSRRRRGRGCTSLARRTGWRRISRARGWRRRAKVCRDWVSARGTSGEGVCARARRARGACARGWKSGMARNRRRNTAPRSRRDVKSPHPRVSLDNRLREAARRVPGRVPNRDCVVLRSERRTPQCRTFRIRMVNSHKVLHMCDFSLHADLIGRFSGRNISHLSIGTPDAPDGSRA